jgi:hypothetical protein
MNNTLAPRINGQAVHDMPEMQNTPSLIRVFRSEIFEVLGGELQLVCILTCPSPRQSV